MWIATQIYAAVNTYFGHWRGVPDLDFDKEFQTYLSQVIASDDRVKFDIATFELVAKLKNGHSGFNDYWLWDTHGQMLGFHARPIDHSWVVTDSITAGPQRGDIVASINGKDFNEFFLNVSKYLPGSNQRKQQFVLTDRPYLFPESFELGLADGREISITRKGWPKNEHYHVTAEEKNDIAYVKIPSFNDQELEQAAIAAVKRTETKNAIILDLRGNTGGTTPQTLLGRLMNRPFRWWSQSTPLTMGLLKYQGVLGEHSDVFSRWAIRSGKDGYQGALYILVDVGCGSACEDFLISFKDNHRAVIIGETTSGSTGQPVAIDFGNGMHLAIRARRVLFADGSQFEGVGIQPDIEVQTTAEDVRSGRDPYWLRHTSWRSGRQRRSDYGFRGEMRGNGWSTTPTPSFTARILSARRPDSLVTVPLGHVISMLSTVARCPSPKCSLGS